jgi:hypothetical protein
MAIQSWAIEEVKSGHIRPWSGLRANIPSGWVECDGTNGTPDMRGYHVKGAVGGQEANVVSGADTHGHGLGTLATLTFTGTRKGGTSGNATLTDSHLHSLTGALNTASSEPLTKTTIWIMKL